MNDRPTLELSGPEVRDAVARAARIRLLGMLFERPTAERRREIMALAGETGNDPPRDLTERLLGMDEATYVALLGPGGPVSPREVAYRRLEDPGRIMADVAAFYDAFGYHPRAEDPVDHVAVETGFLSFLCLKEAYARLSGKDAEGVAEARDRFVSDHLSPLASGLAARLETVAAPDLLHLARTLCDLVGARPRPIPNEASGDDDEMTCGACGTP